MPFVYHADRNRGDQQRGTSTVNFPGPGIYSLCCDSLLFRLVFCFLRRLLLSLFSHHGTAGMSIVAHLRRNLVFCRAVLTHLRLRLSFRRAALTHVRRCLTFRRAVLTHVRRCLTFCRPVLTHVRRRLHSCRSILAHIRRRLPISTAAMPAGTTMSLLHFFRHSRHVALCIFCAVFSCASFSCAVFRSRALRRVAERPAFKTASGLYVASGLHTAAHASSGHTALRVTIGCGDFFNRDLFRTVSDHNLIAVADLHLGAADQSRAEGTRYFP